MSRVAFFLLGTGFSEVWAGTWDATSLVQFGEIKAHGHNRSFPRLSFWKNQPSVESVSQRSKQYVKQWVDSAIKHVTPDLNPAMAMMAGSVIVPMIMKKRESLTPNKTRLFDALVAIKPLPKLDGMDSESFADLMDPFISAFNTSGFTKAADNIVTLQNITRLHGRLHNAFSSEERANMHLTGFNKQHLLRVAKSFNESGWSDTSTRILEASAGIHTARILLTRMNTTVAEVKKNQSNGEPLNQALLPDLIEDCSRLINESGQERIAMDLHKIAKVVRNETVIFEKLVAVREKMSNDSVKGNETYFWHTVAKAFGESGYEEVSNELQRLAPWFGSLPALFGNFVSLTHAKVASQIPPIFSAMANITSMNQAPEAVSNFFRDLAVILGKNETDTQLLPRIAQFVHEEHLLPPQVEGSFADRVAALANAVCSLEGVGELALQCSQFRRV